MLRFKNTIILFLTFLLLGIIVLIVENPFKEPKKKGGPEDSLFTGINSEDVSRIEITKGAENAVLEKRDGNWIISSLKDLPDRKSVV